MAEHTWNSSHVSVLTHVPVIMHKCLLIRMAFEFPSRVCFLDQNRGAEGRSVVVQERRLLVGVHNGWGWVEKPHVLVLESEARGSGAAKARGASSGGSFRQTSTDKLRWVVIPSGPLISRNSEKCCHNSMDLTSSCIQFYWNSLIPDILDL